MPSPPPQAPRTGRTPTGRKFPVPPTADMFHTLASPSRCGPAEILTHVLMALTVLSLLLRPPPFFYIAIFLFWRVCYNAGLAVILHRQSATSATTTWLQALPPSARSLLCWAATRSVRPPYVWRESPAAFNAWLVFRSLSTVVLANDGVSYLALCFSLFRPLSASSLPMLAVCLPAGLALIALSLWAKHAAHAALGDFAWFWGDFFFTIDGDLVLDGIFELFPHPMYTVGYAAYYGSALICRSYTLLLVSLLAHLAQLAFLALVEEPHIRKIYAPRPSAHVDLPPTADARPASDAPATPLASDDPGEHAQFLATAPQPAVYVALCALLTTLIVLAAAAPRRAPLVIALLLAWRALHWAGCAVLLRRGADGAENLWLRWCLARGSTRSQAFSTWQHVFLFSYLLNHALFIVAVLSLPAATAGSPALYSFAKDWSHVLGGLSLVAIAFVSMFSAWSVTGYFGFFYGDFFVSPESRELLYSGSFRYVSNPEASLGYLAYYGLAIMRQSRSLFVLALACQGMHMMFISFVEEENIGREYKFVRRSTALESSVANLPLVRSLLISLRRAGLKLVEVIHRSSGTHLEIISKKVAVQKEKLQADLNKATSVAWEKHVVRRATDLKSKAESATGMVNCNQIISMLENKGIVVERVADSEIE